MTGKRSYIRRGGWGKTYGGLVSGWVGVGASGRMLVRDEVNPEEFSGERFPVALESFLRYRHLCN